MLKIAIPSKDRAGEIETIKTFEEKGIGKDCFKIYVEPQDIADYRVVYSDYEVVNIEENNRGEAYVRNFILNDNRDNILMLDDDIVSLQVRRHGKLFELENAVPMIEAIEECFRKGFLQTTISFAPSNWYNPTSYKVNARTWCFAGMNCAKLKEHGIRYDDNLKMFVDYDITAQIIQKGFQNISLYNYAFDCKPMGSNSGGWQCFDRKQLTIESIEYLKNKYRPDQYKLIMNDRTGIEEIQFLWKKL